MLFALVPAFTQTRLAVDDAWLARVAYACMVQLNRDVGGEWGGDYDVRPVSGPIALHEGENAFALLDTLPDAPGDVAYHTVDGNDVPVLVVGLDTCATLDDLSIAISHELCETAGDEAINAWRDDGRGAEWAQELCDAVQSRSYEIPCGVDRIRVSDFVLRAYFEPTHAGPYTYLARVGLEADVAAPFGLASGGYAIRRDSGGQQTQVFGELGMRAMRAKHWGSRTRKRGVRV